MVRVFQQLAVCVFARLVFVGVHANITARAVRHYLSQFQLHRQIKIMRVYMWCSSEGESATLLTLGCAGKALLSVTF
jgi:hypothetical protein